MEGVFYRKVRKKLSLTRHLRNKRLLVTVTIALPVLFYVLFGSHGVIQRIRLEQEKSELQAKIKAAGEENLRLQAEAKALDSDIKAVERVAREKYGMAREGETVYRVRKSEQESAPSQ